MNFENTYTRSAKLVYNSINWRRNWGFNYVIFILLETKICSRFYDYNFMFVPIQTHWYVSNDYRGSRDIGTFFPFLRNYCQNGLA